MTREYNLISSKGYAFVMVELEHMACSGYGKGLVRRGRCRSRIHRIFMGREFHLQGAEYLNARFCSILAFYGV